MSHTIRRSVPLEGPASGALVLASLLLLAPSPAFAMQEADTGRSAAAAFFGGPLLSRGAIQLETKLTSTEFDHLYHDGMRAPLGGNFFLPSLGVDQLPELEDTRARFREVAGDGSEWIVNLGAVGGHVRADEQVFPVRIGYGLLDRVSLGVTVPFVRRRVSSRLTPAGTGATAGANPGSADQQAVADFMSGATEAMNELQAWIEVECTPNVDGDEDGGEEPAEQNGGPDCVLGEELLASGSSFLAALDAAYEEALVFPLRGSTAASGLVARWSEIRARLEPWEVEAPAEPPVATRPIDDDTFVSRFVAPAWGAAGFPVETQEVTMQLGDVEAHLVLGLLQLGEGGDGFRLRTAVVATARFPTGATDSLQAVVPMAPPRGVGATGVRVVVDALSPYRFALFAQAEGWSYRESDVTLLAPDHARLLGPDAIARAQASWRPGSTFRVRVTPRVHVIPALSVGVGYAMDRREADEYRFAEPITTPLAATTGTSKLHRIRGEFRFHGFEPEVMENLPFPIEVGLTYDRTFRGSGPAAPIQSRIQLLLRLRPRD